MWTLTALPQDLAKFSAKVSAAAPLEPLEPALPALAAVRRSHGAAGESCGDQRSHFTIETSAIWYLWLTKCALFHFYKSISSEWD